MQAPSGAHQLYHNPYYPGPQDYELKRQYLALLPPQQIIDICLAFDVHVPPYIKSTVWPLDINAAISALSKTRPPDSIASTAKPDNVPVMDSLTDLQADGPDKSATETTPTDQGSSTPTKLPNSSESGPPSPNNQPASQQLPHHSYSFPSQPAYPHVPYYPPPPPGYPSYPNPYSAYPPPPSIYPVPLPPGYPPNSLPPGGPVPHPRDPYGTHNGDDLPSYEEMIVEALVESNDPEGCAPKDLFAWMASHYPLQSNFRPSASQALQKAYKRGRFEKTSSGKYRLNATWEGGNTSRRTTRRPQTQSQSTTTSSSTHAPPFTQAPLVHHYSHQPPGLRPYPGQPYGYPYGPVVTGYPSYPHPLQSPAQQPTTTSASRDEHSSDREARDAYETAQSILKAINFGGLLQLSNEHGTESANKVTDSVIAEGITLEPTRVETSDGAPPMITSSNGRLVDRGATAAREMEAITMGPPRAELQARLALLAAQLAEIAEEQLPGVGVVVPRGEATEPKNPDEESDDDEMEAII
ncbi:hypothetical protein AX15_005022 [Amanita polypyramis BW_CC]|nr:hypothetical protein AX15_005022 [Amanita polypyramis BW_CC]